jgi:hypothetical protein
MAQNDEPRISPHIAVSRGVNPGRFSSHGGRKGLGHEFVNGLVKVIAVCCNCLLVYWGVFGRDVAEEKISMPMKQDSRERFRQVVGNVD